MMEGWVPGGSTEAADWERREVARDLYVEGDMTERGRERASQVREIWL